MRLTVLLATLLAVAGCTGMLLGSGGSQPAATAEDSRISAAVRARLADDLVLGVRGLQVETSGRQVTLRGSVANHDDRERAARIARGVEGVRGVVNRLQVVSTPRRY